MWIKFSDIKKVKLLPLNVPPVVHLVIFFLFGVILIGGVIFTISHFLGNKTEFIDQYDAIAVWQNNSEGNWDIAYSIYKAKYNTWIHQKDRDIYYDGNANLIAKIPGNDVDPDISSSKHRALAVWSNTGADGNKGADIFAAFWAYKPVKSWEKPYRLFALEGDDLDPTVYMQDSNNALVVWINKKGKRTSLYYSVYRKGQWSNPKSFFSAPDISFPELGYMTLPQSKYLLMFNARENKVNGKNIAYTGVYDPVNGWQIFPVKGQKFAALVDDTIPVISRVGSSMHVLTHKLAGVWQTANNQIHYFEASPAKTEFIAQKLTNGYNPVVIQEPWHSTGYATVIFSTKDSLINWNVIGENTTQVISQGEKNAVRPDATYFWENGVRSAVVVWATQQEDPSEIYFSALDSNTQRWSPPERIDLKGFAGEDKNPAVTPILVRITQEKELFAEEDIVMPEEYCGDKRLQAPEECEVGIACADPSKICDIDLYGGGVLSALLFANCECLSLDDNPEPPAPKPEPFPGFPEFPKFEKNKTESYGGASCGFNEVVLESKIEKNEVSLQFLPEVRGKGNGIVRFYGEYPQYQARMVLFPLSQDVSGEARKERFVKIEFKDNDNVIFMRGFQESPLFQLCEGKFTKGVKPGPTHLKVAPAGGDSYKVPTIPVPGN